MPYLQTKLKILALGGTLRPSSSGAAALRVCLAAAEHWDCSVNLITGTELDFPTYDPSSPDRSRGVCNLLDAVRTADGLLICSPGYHGSLSGMVKNALDYLEDLRDEPRSYLSDVPVGCIVSAAGWQACGSTLAALRAVVHALRGWPTPIGVTFNSTSAPFRADGTCADDPLKRNLVEMTRQVVQMARLRLTSSSELISFQGNC